MTAPNVVSIRELSKVCRQGEITRGDRWYAV